MTVFDAAIEHLPVETPEASEPRPFNDAGAAVGELQRLYERSVAFLTGKFAGVLEHTRADRRYRAFYPEISLTTRTHARVDSRLAFGYVPQSEWNEHARYSINLPALDDLDPADLIASPVTYYDGLNDNWWHVPVETRHL